MLTNGDLLRHRAQAGIVAFDCVDILIGCKMDFEPCLLEATVKSSAAREQARDLNFGGREVKHLALSSFLVVY